MEPDFYPLLGDGYALVIDTETTGKIEPIQPIQVAYAYASDSDKQALSPIIEKRFKPDKPIEWGAAATHHILDSDVKFSEPHKHALLEEGHVKYIIGHNVSYDYAVIGSPAGVKLIDTLALSRAAWPSLDSHKLSAIAYFLFGKDIRDTLRSSHDAAIDVAVCHKVLMAALVKLGHQDDTWAEIHQLSEACRIPTHMPFGKHKGLLIKSLPADYVAWLVKQDIDSYLRSAISGR